MAKGKKTDISTGADTDVTPEEKAVLENIDYRKADSEDQPLIEGQLDETDDDGDPLNEKDDLDGEDLDVPGTEEDDDDEAIGEEDEENNDYSLNDDDRDLEE